MDMGVLATAFGQRLLRIVIVTALLLAATYGLLGFVPKTYMSTAAILYEPRDTTFTRAADGLAQAPTAAITADTAIASQVELIRSRGTLLEVAESERLNEIDEFNGKQGSLLGTLRRLLGRSSTAQNTVETVLGNLASRLKVFRARQSHVISIEFRSTDPVLAARIANAVATVHARRRADVIISDTNQASQWLLVEIEKMRTLVAEAEAKVAAYRVDNDLFVGDNNTSLLDQQLSDISAQIIATQERKNTARSRASLISGLLDAGQPIDGVSDVRDSVVVQRLSEEKARLQGDRAQRLATLLPNHPDIRSLSAQIAEIDKQILSEGQQVADGLVAEARIEAGVEKSLREELTRLKINVSGATRDTVALNELQRESAAQRGLLETFLLRYRDAAARSDVSLVLPDVRVISEAAAAISPSSPKTMLILLAVAMVSVVLQTGQILFSELLSGRALTRPSRRGAYNDYQEPAAEEYEEHRADNSQHDDGASQGPAEVGEANTLVEASDDTSTDEMPGFEAEDFAEPVQTSRTSPPVAARAIPQPRPSRARRAQNINTVSVSQVADHLATGQENLVLVVTLSGWRESRSTIESLTAELVQRQLSVVEIDAGSRQAGGDLGLSDLIAGKADFGDVVHRGRRSDFAIVPWGQQEEMDLNSPHCDTLIDALSDIFEIVIIDTGRAGMASSLPAFAGHDALVVLAMPDSTASEQFEQVRHDLADLGFENLQVVALKSANAQVA